MIRELGEAQLKYTDANFPPQVVQYLFDKKYIKDGRICMIVVSHWLVITRIELKYFFEIAFVASTKLLLHVHVVGHQFWLMTTIQKLENASCFTHTHTHIHIILYYSKRPAGFYSPKNRRFKRAPELTKCIYSYTYTGPAHSLCAIIKWCSVGRPSTTIQ